MKNLKEYLLVKYFSAFGYAVAALYVPALVTFTVVTEKLRTSERRTFSCDVPTCREDCLRKYDEQYSSPFPLYVFCLLSFVPLVAVCIAYSWCFVKSRVDEIEAIMKPDLENPRPRRRTLESRRVFKYYFLHLLVRLLLGILCAVLQNFAFYTGGFPMEFACRVCKTTSLKSTPTNMNGTKVHLSTFYCDNPVGSDIATWAKIIFAVHLVFSILVAAEMFYLVVQGLNNRAFTLDSEFCLEHFFNKRTPDAVKLREYTLRLKNRMGEKTEYLESLLTFDSLGELFVDLVIYSRRAEHKFGPKLKRHQIYDVYLKPQLGSVTIKEPEELFLPNADSEEPKKILIVGRPGIGTSLLCTKLLHDWSKDKLFGDSDKTFGHVFLIQFRWFNTETAAEKKISLKQLLTQVCPDDLIDNDIFQHILDNPEQVLIIFDGLDEFKHHKDCLYDAEMHCGDGATEEMQFSELYAKLVKNKQLPGATVVTTLRPTVDLLQSVASLRFDRHVEIMGLTPEKVQTYVSKFCAHNTQTMNKIWMHISSNPDLLSLCYIPVNSAIVCSLLEKWIMLELDEQDSGSTLPKTSTEVYEGALRLFIFKHHPEFKDQRLTPDFLRGNTPFSDSIKETLDQAGLLAKRGIEKGNLLFESTEVQGMENCGLFNNLPDIEVSPYQFKSHYCFIHLSLQEFLAARVIANMSPSDLINFIFSSVSDSKWCLVIQFVAGLLRGQENEVVDSFVHHLHECLRIRPSSTDVKQRALLMLKCLYEYNNETTLRSAALTLLQNSTFDTENLDFSNCQVTPVECAAISFFVKHCGELTVLDLSDNLITCQGVSHLVAACNISELNLSGNMITDQGVLHLCTTLKNVNSKLTKLNLSGGGITDQGVFQLCNAIEDVNCSLSELRLSSNYSITDQGILPLCNSKLTGLDLSNTNVTDEGVLHLCDALKNENSKLTKLCLSGTKITDRGATGLCDAMKNVHCKLTDLNLSCNRITDQGLRLLCDAQISENCKLANLNISGNSITDKGVQFVCELLNHENCKLVQLNLASNSITDRGLLCLCKVNCKLTDLDLSDNITTDYNSSRLLDAQKDINISF